MSGEGRGLTREGEFHLNMGHTASVDARRPPSGSRLGLRPVILGFTRRLWTESQSSGLSLAVSGGGGAEDRPSPRAQVPEEVAVLGGFGLHTHKR